LIREDFAGAGGVSEGLRLAGVTDRVVGVENWSYAVATARAAGHERILADVRSPVVRDASWEIDGYAGGPPCQTFSVAGKGTGRAALDDLIAAARRVADGDLPEEAIAKVRTDRLDERSLLVLEPLLVIARHRPRWIMLEQVPAVRPIWDAYAIILTGRWGYSVTVDVLHSEQYGVPQTRRRAVLLGSLNRQVRMPMPTHSRFYPSNPAKLDPGVKKWVSMAEALESAGLAVRGDYVRSNYGSGGDASKRGERCSGEPAFVVTSKADRNKWQLNDKSAGGGGSR
jgi:DNA (cytosine-5)-methyltransferase 1